MIPEEYELLLLAALSGGRSDRATLSAELISAGDFNWDHLYDLAEYHAVRLQLDAFLSGSGLYGKTPDDFAGKLQGACRKNLLDQLDSAREFFRIRDRIAGENLRAIPFKGFTLAENYYGGLAGRETSDTDLFICYADLPAIGKVMAGAGYRVGAPFLEKPDPKDCEYSYGLFEGGRCISFTEFHWRVAPDGFGLDITLDELSSQIIMDEIQGQPAEVFSHAASLLLTVMHHGGKDAFAKLKQVSDIARMLNSREETDYQWLLKTAEKYGCLSLLAVSARLASVLTGMTVPGWIADPAGVRRIRRLAENRVRTLAIAPAYRRRLSCQVSDWVFRIRSRDGLGIRIRLAWRFIRKVLLPWLVPVKLHHLFMRKYITPDYAREV